jgi:hypothetical protein
MSVNQRNFVSGIVFVGIHIEFRTVCTYYHLMRSNHIESALFVGNHVEISLPFKHNRAFFPFKSLRISQFALRIQPNLTAVGENCLGNYSRHGSKGDRLFRHIAIHGRQQNILIQQKQRQKNSGSRTGKIPRFFLESQKGNFSRQGIPCS